MALEANLEDIFWGSVTEYTDDLGNFIENPQNKQELQSFLFNLWEKKINDSLFRMYYLNISDGYLHWLPKFLHLVFFSHKLHKKMKLS